VSGVPLAGVNDAVRPIRVWSVDDDLVFQQLLIALLGSQPGVIVEDHFGSASAALTALRSVAPPDAILLDAEMLGMIGVDAIPPILELAPTTRILMLSTFLDSKRATVAKERGAFAYLTKTASAGEIVAAIRRSLAMPAPLRLPVPEAATARTGVPGAMWLLWINIFGRGSSTPQSALVPSEIQAKFKCRKIVS
jgi:DNA-binding NtrC family response regulator